MMMTIRSFLFFASIIFNVAYALPTGFVYLRQVDNSILQEIRYASFHNFIGRPIKGYVANECILTNEAANALAKVQAFLRQSSLSLKVYDCYRPKVAVDDFIAWSQDKIEEAMKTEFYPNVNKAELFNLGYIAKKSGHSRGSTIDLTIVPIPFPNQPTYHPKEKLMACTASYQQRFRDNSINMGTGYDCLDKLSHAQNKNINEDAIINRKLLREAMEKHNFIPYAKEWWHFTLNQEPYPHTYFNFPVTKSVVRDGTTTGKNFSRPRVVQKSAFSRHPSRTTPNNETLPAYILTLADIHFDPFLTCTSKPCPLIQKLRIAPISEWEAFFAANETDIKYLQDSSFALVKSALMAAKVEAEKRNVQFVLILGDFLGHNFKRHYKTFSNDSSTAGYQLFVNKVLAFLNNEISAAFPQIDVYAVVGNNDTYQKDYQSTPHGPFFISIAKWWPSLIKTKLNRDIAQKEMANAGYYAVTISGQPNLRLIVLNTNLFSGNSRGINNQKAGDSELNWLREELTSVKKHHQKAFIAMHIPQGIDIYATKGLRLFRLLELWKSSYSERFDALLKEFSANITSMFAGHLHVDWSQILTFNQEEMIEGQTPSISPIFGNNPGFKIYQFSPQSFKVQGYTTHYYYPLNNNQIWSSSAAK